MEYVPEVLLWLFVVNLGTAYGAGLYETRIVLPQWFIKSPEFRFRVDSEAMRQNDTGRKFWGFVTTMPLTLLTIASLVFACQTGGARQDWWLAAALVTLVERLGTFCFFIPIAIKLMRADTMPADKVGFWVVLWTRSNYLRLALNLLGWLLAMKALTLPL